MVRSSIASGKGLQGAQLYILLPPLLALIPLPGVRKPTGSRRETGSALSGRLDPLYDPCPLLTSQLHVETATNVRQQVSVRIP